MLVDPRFVAILEDHPERAARMRRVLAEILPAFNVIIFESAASMIRWLEDSMRYTVLICLDHDLIAHDGRDPGTGRLVVNYLATLQCTCPVIVHTSNLQAAPGMMCMLREAGWICSYVTPSDGFEWIGKDWLEEVEQYQRRGWIFA
jgi:hypothetical protein